MTTVLGAGTDPERPARTPGTTSKGSPAPAPNCSTRPRKQRAMAGAEGDPLVADTTSALGALLGYRAYARRWVFLLVLSLLNFSNATVRGSGGCLSAGAGLGPSPSHRAPRTFPCPRAPRGLGL